MGIGHWFRTMRGNSANVASAPGSGHVDRVPRAPGPEPRVMVGTATNAGCVRHVNEDTVHVERLRHANGAASTLLAVVCDGMGGHVAGATASRLAARTLAQALTESDDPGASLVSAMGTANRAVYESAQADATLRGMGTTCTALVLQGSRAWCAHVGDSRCYLVRNGEGFLMTEDHSAVMALVRRGELSREEARSHPERHVIVRALGSQPTVAVSSWPRPFAVRPGDRFLLSSDGLHDVVPETELVRIACDGSPDVACHALVAAARERGAPDNVSVVLLAVPDKRNGTDRTAVLTVRS